MIVRNPNDRQIMIDRNTNDRLLSLLIAIIGQYNDREKSQMIGRNPNDRQMIGEIMIDRNSQ